MVKKQKVIQTESVTEFEELLNNFSIANKVFATQTHVTALANMKVLYTAVLYYEEAN